MGYPIPNQTETLKLSQYADNTNLFTVTESWLAEIVKIFSEYEIATGSAINESKTAKIFQQMQKSTI